jgi:ferric-dicitrate binding protein FerR (iron transport regulator)
MNSLAVFSYLSVATVAALAMVSIKVWSDNRRREREAFYRYETLRKLADVQGAGAQQVLEVMHAQQRVASRQIREGLKLGGLAACGAGAGLLAMFWSLDRLQVGFVPLFVGMALLLYAYGLAPKD